MRATLVSLFCAALLSVRPAPSPAVRFTDVLSQTGITFRHASGASEEKYLIETMGAGCGLIDYDQDGWLDIYFVNVDGHEWLDLYVANYLDFTYDKNPYCDQHTAGRRGYCHPDHYNGVPNLLYRNNHDGTFTEVGKKAGIVLDDSKGLGVVAGDF